MPDISATQIIEIPQISVLILAGGKGTRLKEAVRDRPKVLAPVDGQPWLYYLLRQLEGAGVRKVVLCTGYMAEKVEEAFGARLGDLEIQYSVEVQPLGTAGALRNALPKCQHSEILVLNGDSYCEFDLGGLYAFHAGRKASSTIVVTHMNSAARFGQVIAEHDGRIIRFEEKIAEAGPGWVNAGVYLINRALLQAIPQGRPISLENECFPQWIGAGFYAFPSDSDKFLDIGIPESFATAKGFVRGLL